MSASCVQTTELWSGMATASSVRARHGYRVGVLSVWGIVLMCLCTYGPTIHLRTHYSDDYVHRIAVEKSNWWDACREYRSVHGLLRPLGLAAVLVCQQALWDYPVAQQAIMLGCCIALCLLMYAFVLRLTGDGAVALTAAVILAAWPSYTSMVVWVAGGLQMLPAYTTYLAALLFYLWHLHAPSKRKWWYLSLALFAVSVTLHDQHLGAVAAFSVLALLHGRPGERVNKLLGTLPFWLVALAMALTTMLTAQGTERPLEPTATNLAAGLASVLWAFVNMSLVEPFRHCLYGAGPRESLSRMASTDPALLVMSAILLAASIGITIALLRRIRPTRHNAPRLATLAVVGAVILLTGLGIMALQESASIKPRHTLVPAIGLAMMLGATMGALHHPRSRAIGVLALAALLPVLSVFRLGHTYDWTTRARVTEQVLTSLDELYPTAHSGDLLIIDGVRKYGRGFADSWGLSGALSLRRGLPLKVATLVRREGDRLLANAAWDANWEVKPASTRFFTWNQAHGELRAQSYAEFLARHSELQRPG